jgi:long-subunit acyl-CoA synthetase (AMP-forming)
MVTPPQSVRSSISKVVSWSDLLAAGAKAPAAPQPPGAEELCTIMYTSGTTGGRGGVDESCFEGWLLWIQLVVYD